MTIKKVWVMLGNRYQLGEKIGAGAMGTVYLGTDTHSQQPVAIKHLKNDHIEPELIERFKREGEALRELNHPNIVKLLETVEDKGAHYLVMEYVAGGELSDLLKNGQLPLERCLKLALDLADALTRAHKLDIIHRDLKPPNILLDDNGTLRLTDFGVAHIGQKERMTDSGMMIGTLPYMSPEMVEGKAIDSRADIWAFGVTLFEMLTGERPFKGDTVYDTYTAILNQPMPDLEALRPDVPIALVDLVYRMLEKDRNTRIRSVRQVGLELEDILHGRTMQTATRFAHEMADLPQRSKHNLPTQTTPFIGREAELGELAKLLDEPQIRLITILAPGGMGKTRLALELVGQYVTPPQPLSEASRRGFTDGVYFVELAPLLDAGSIVSAIAEATSYQLQRDGREPKQQVLDFLANKNMLLLLDNFEHLLEGASLVTEILQAAPQVKILVTSRQRLNQSGETVFSLQGMDFPAWETPQDALDYAAVKLFMQSAKRSQPDFDLTNDNIDGVARICKLVQGMPLGIVLAAAWVSLLSTAEIADEIAQSIDFLVNEMGDMPERQRSVRAVFEYSWQQMTDIEQQVFMKLSVFRGGFSRDAGQKITGATLQQLMSLANKSLIRRDNQNGRYEIHELLRQYAAEKARQSRQVEVIGDAHALYYADLMHELETPLKFHRQRESLADMAADFENMRAAWIWAVEQEQYEVLNRMQECLRIYCFLTSHFQDGLALFDVAVQRLEGSQDNAHRIIYGRLLTRLAMQYQGLEQIKAAQKPAEDGLQIAREQGNRYDVAVALLVQVLIKSRMGEVEEAWTIAEESRAIFREIGDKFGESNIISFLAFLAFGMNQYEKGEQLWLELLSHTKAIGNIVGNSLALLNLGVLELSVRKNPVKAEALFLESLKNYRALGLAHLKQRTLDNLVSLYCEQGRLDEAEKAAIEAVQIAREINYHPAIIGSLLQLGLVRVYQEDYEAALALADEAQRLAQADDVFIHIARGFVLCGMGNYIEAEKLYIATLQELVSSPDVYSRVNCVFGFSFLLTFLRQQHERALVLASVVAHHPTTSWWHVLPLAQRLVAHLQQKLPTNVYADVWERGKSLDFEVVFQELAAEFGTA